MNTKQVTQLSDAIAETNKTIIELLKEKALNNTLSKDEESMFKFVYASGNTLIKNAKLYESVVNCNTPFPNINSKIENKKAPFTLYTFNNKCSRNKRGKIYSLSDFMLTLAYDNANENLIEVIDLNKADNLTEFKKTPFYTHIVDNDKSEFVLVHKNTIVNFETRTSYDTNIHRIYSGYKTYNKLVFKHDSYNKFVVSLVDPNRHLLRAGSGNINYLYSNFEQSVNKYIYRPDALIDFYRTLLLVIKQTKDLQEPIFEPLPRTN